MKIVDPTDPPEGFNPAESVPQRTAQILRWQGITKHDLSTDLVLGAAGERGLRAVVVLGYTAEGAEYFASSIADGADVLWLLERLKRQLLTTGLDSDADV